MKVNGIYAEEIVLTCPECGEPMYFCGLENEDDDLGFVEHVFECTCCDHAEKYVNG